MIHLRSSKGCSHCPYSMLCLTGKPIPASAFCRRCGAVVFRHENQSYLCTRLRDGHYERAPADVPQVRGRRALRRLKHDKRIARILRALQQPKEYTGCVIIWPHPRGLVVDCVHYSEPFDRIY